MSLELFGGETVGDIGIIKQQMKAGKVIEKDFIGDTIGEHIILI